MRSAIGPRTKLLFLANPNNPTGTLSSDDCIRALLDLGIMVVVDETYHEFCGATVAPLVDEYDNLVILRTLSKWAGLAGMRLGYGIMAPVVAERLMTIKPPYNLTVASEVALLASLADRDALLANVATLVQERDRMASRLSQLPGVSLLSVARELPPVPLPCRHGATPSSRAWPGGASSSATSATPVSPTACASARGRRPRRTYCCRS